VVNLAARLDVAQGVVRRLGQQVLQELEANGKVMNEGWGGERHGEVQQQGWGWGGGGEQVLQCWRGPKVVVVGGGCCWCVLGGRGERGC